MEENPAAEKIVHCARRKRGRSWNMRPDNLSGLRVSIVLLGFGYSLRVGRLLLLSFPPLISLEVTRAWKVKGALPFNVWVFRGRMDSSKVRGVPELPLWAVSFLGS